MLDLIVLLIIALLINLILFIPAYKFQTDKLTDLSYSLTFIILSTIALTISKISLTKIILYSIILIWSLRLGIFLLIRIRKIKKDNRFNKIRNSLPKFILFWIFQGISVWIILLPSLIFLTTDSPNAFYPGIIIWIIGLAIETIADNQKFKFKQKHKNKFIKSGLWKYSRHPNYFGEILCWIGIYLFTIPALTAFQKTTSLISPLLIIILLVFISGIPQSEKSAKEKYGKEYRIYKQKTSILILLPPKNNPF